MGSSIPTAFGVATGSMIRCGLVIVSKLPTAARRLVGQFSEALSIQEFPSLATGRRGDGSVSRSCRIGFLRGVERAKDAGHRQRVDGPRDDFRRLNVVLLRRLARCMAKGQLRRGR